MGNTNTKAVVKEKKEKEMEEKELSKIDKEDQMAMFNFLSDKMLEFFQTYKEYDICFRWDNMKLAAMVFAVAVGVMSHFHSLFFSTFLDESSISLLLPDDNNIVYACVAGFFIISTALWAFVIFVEKDIVLTCTSKKTNENIYVRAELPRYDEYFIYSFERTPTSAGKKKNTNKMQDKIYVGRLFDKEGFFDQKAYFTALSKHLEKFERKKKD